jgi:preprotein translocase subunit SecY
MTAPVGISTRTQRSRLHWALRAVVLGFVAGAVSLPFWSGIAQPLIRFEVVYWSSPAPLSPQKWALQAMAWRWVIAQPVSFRAWLLTLLTGAAILGLAYWWETWASRPMDSAQQICKE